MRVGRWEITNLGDMLKLNRSGKTEVKNRSLTRKVEIIRLHRHLETLWENLDFTL